MDPGPESHTDPQVPLSYEQQQLWLYRVENTIFVKILFLSLMCHALGLYLTNHSAKTQLKKLTLVPQF